MKIKANEMQPGMVIGIDRGHNYEDVSLVIAKKGFVEVEYTHFDFQDSYHGAMVGTIKGKKKIKVIKGKKRRRVIEQIKSDLHKNYHDVSRNIDTVWLILAMDNDNT